MAVRQDGMVQFTGRQDLALNQPKVLVDVCVTWMCNKGRMSFRVDRGFVDPWVQRGDIDVMDLLTGGPLMVQFHRIGTSSTESVTWIQRFCALKVSYKRVDVKGGVFEMGPIASPHFHHGVSLFS